MRTLVILITGIAAIVYSQASWAEKPVKVYILAGQSNMHCQV